MTVNTKLSINDYLALVDAIVAGYFVDGEYSPQYGFVNEVALFYGLCVESEELEAIVPHDILSIDIDEVQKLIENEEFMKAFRKAIDWEGHDFTFSNARFNAQEIVNSKKDSLNMIVDRLGTMLSEVIDKISGTMTSDNLQILSTIVGEVNEGNLNMDNFLNAYKESQTFKDKVADNVVPMAMGIAKDE